MQLIHDPCELQPRRRICVGIGVFDGVHLGHQQVIRQTIADARRLGACAVVVTFDRHPNAIVAPDRVPPAIQSVGQKSRTLAELGVDVTWLIAFDVAFSRLPGDVFVRRLAAELGHLQSVCVGSEFTFGHKRSGNVALLRALGSGHVARGKRPAMSYPHDWQRWDSWGLGMTRMKAPISARTTA